MKKMTEKGGITLVALVITIIILLILAGIIISRLTSSGLLGRAEQAEQEYQESEAEENLKIKLSSILIEESGKKDLSDLDGMIVDGYKTDVSNTGKVISMSKDNTTYYFFVDSEYNVQTLNNTSSGISSGAGNISQGTSNLITEINLIVEYIGSTSIKLKVEVSEKEIENVVGYQVVVNNKVKKISEENEILISGLSTTTQYSIVAQVIDENGQIKASNEEIITTTDITYLYNRGDYCEELTGGWKYSGGYAPSASHWTTYDDYMQIVSPAYTRTYITTNNAIDLTNYNTLTIICETSYGSIGAPSGYITTSSTVSSDPSTFSIKTENVVVDISKYTGKKYIHLNSSNGTLKIYEVYLEE